MDPEMIADIRERRAFTFQLPHVIDTDYSLDYIDSIGDRHLQELSRLDFSDKDIPLLIESSLTYFPAELLGEDADDIYHGELRCELPILGTRRINNLDHIKSVMFRQLSLRFSDAMPMYKTDDDVLLFHDQSLEPISIELQTSDDTTLRVLLTVPCDGTLSNKERHEDMELAAELFAELHDFGANLSILTNCHSSALGRLAHSASNPAQTLRIGYDRMPHTNRIGTTLLTALDDLSTLNTSRSMPMLSRNINYELLEHHLADYNDQAVLAIARRACLTAEIDINHTQTEPNVTNEHILGAIRFQKTLDSLSVEVST